MGNILLVKRKMKQRDVCTPQEMMKIIEYKDSRNVVYQYYRVDWVNWKAYLKPFLPVPNSFRITK